MTVVLVQDHANNDALLLFQPYHNFSKSDPVEDLANCQRKLEVLLTGLGLWKKTPELSPVNLNEHKVRSSLFNIILE